MGKIIMCRFLFLIFSLEILAKTCTEEEVVVREKCEKICAEKFWQCLKTLEIDGCSGCYEENCYDENTKCIDGKF